MAFATLATPSGQLPSIGSDVSFKARVLANNFGDGYRQTFLDGKNAVMRSWPVKWNSISIADANYLDAFFLANAGQVFLYTLPRESVARKWDCAQWGRGFPSTGYDTYSANLEERFDNG